MKNKGTWADKQQGKNYRDFDNFNFHPTGAALGLPEEVLLRGEGWAQQQAGTSKSEFGFWWEFAPYGFPVSTGTRLIPMCASSQSCGT